MIRDFTKSAMSFSWALSLLGIKQAVDLFKPKQRSGNLLTPIIQVAVDQLDDSMKNIYRSGDSLQSRAVDLAFIWINPVNWINPNSWTRIFNGGGGQQQSGNGTWHGQSNGFTQGGCSGRSEPEQAGNAHAGPQNTVRQPGGAPVVNETAAVGWGPMPVDS